MLVYKGKTMAIAALTVMCIPPQKTLDGHFKPRLAHDLMQPIDILAGIALLIIGLLGLYGVIPLSIPVTYSLIGMGAIYAGTQLLIVVRDCKIDMECSRDVYLFNNTSE